MPLFVLAYRKPAGYTPTGDTTAAWQAWFASMGDQLADLGKPVTGGGAMLGDCDVCDLVPADRVRNYPTNFRAMSESDLHALSLRGEQLTRSLLSHYCPEL